MSSGFRGGFSQPNQQPGEFFNGLMVDGTLSGELPYDGEWVEGEMKVRDRAKLWTPQEISDIVGWFDSSDLSTLIYDSDLYLDRWLDKSGSGNDLIPGNSNLTRALLGNGVQTEQSGTWLESENSIQQNDEISYVSVFFLRNLVYTSTARLFSWSSNGNDGFNIATSPNEEYFFSFSGDGGGGVVGSFSSSLTDSTIHIISLTYSSISQELIIRIDGKPEITYITNSTSPVNAKFYNFDWSEAPIGNYRTMDGIKFEDIIVNRKLNNNDIGRLEGYLAHKWRLADKLPINHKYRWRPPLMLEKKETKPSYYFYLNETTALDPSISFTAKPNSKIRGLVKYQILS